MPNIHTPERLEGESFTAYKERRAYSNHLGKLTTHGIARDAGYDHFLLPKIKDTKHTRAGSKKRKGAL